MQKETAQRPAFSLVISPNLWGIMAERSRLMLENARKTAALAAELSKKVDKYLQDRATGKIIPLDTWKRQGR